MQQTNSWIIAIFTWTIFPARTGKLASTPTDTPISSIVMAEGALTRVEL